MSARAPEGRGSASWLHLGLYLATFLTTTMSGARARPDGSLLDGLAFSVPVMAILTFHELGHYIAARLHGVPASLPYFIPLPPGLGMGTLGAVITQEGTTDRRKLIDIGAAGPLAGLLVAIPVLLYGLHLSEVKPIGDGAGQEGNSLLYSLLKYAAKGAWLPGGGRDVILHPTALAGWYGLLLTMINLLPIGQLDGGHIATAYFGNSYAKFARLVHKALPWVGLLAFGLSLHAVEQETGGRVLPDGWTPVTIAVLAAVPWFLWFALSWALGRLSGSFDHPRVEGNALPPGRAALFWVVVVAFVMIFMPVPMRVAFGPEPAKPPPAAGATR